MYSDDQRVMTIVMIPISIRFVNNYGFPLLERTLEFIKMQFSRDCIVEFDQNLYSDDQRVMTILMIPISMGLLHSYNFSLPWRALEFIKIQFSQDYIIRFRKFCYSINQLVKAIPMMPISMGFIDTYDFSFL